MSKKENYENGVYLYICAAAPHFSKISSFLPTEAYRIKEEIGEEKEYHDKIFLYVVFRAFFFHSFPPKEMYEIIKSGMEKLAKEKMPEAVDAVFILYWRLFLGMMKSMQEYTGNAIDNGTEKMMALSQYYLHAHFDDSYLAKMKAQSGEKSYNGILHQLAQFFDDFMHMKFGFEYAVVSEIAHRVDSIVDRFIGAYNQYMSRSEMSKYELTELQNDLYHVVHATELLSTEESFIHSKEAPELYGASIILSAHHLASIASKAAEVLQFITRKIMARAETDYHYSRIAQSHDVKVLIKHYNNLLSYRAKVKQEYLSYLLNTNTSQENETNTESDLTAPSNNDSEQMFIKYPTGSGKFDDDLKLDGKIDGLVFVVASQKIKTADYQDARSFFDKLDNEMPVQYRNKVSILVQWDSEDNRELYEIPEVRDYFTNLFHYTDSIFFWLDPYCDFFQLLGFMLFPPVTKYRFINSDTCFVEPSNFAEYVSMGFDQLNQFCDEKGISEEPSSSLISQRVAELFPD